MAFITRSAKNYCTLLNNFWSHFDWPKSLYADFCTPQSHFTKSHQLRTMNERCHTNSVPWMVWIKVALRSWQTACIHGTELVWPRSFMVRSWCDRSHSWYGVDVTASIHGTELVWFRKAIPRGSCVHCTVAINLADFFLFVFHQWQKNPPNFIHKNHPLYGVDVIW
jgi:hypothetical protein